jgi:hypothetical protein
VHPLVEEGPVSDKIAECAEAYDVNLVILGAHGYGPVEKHFVGTTTNKVLTKVSRPILNTDAYVQLADTEKPMRVTAAPVGGAHFRLHFRSSATFMRRQPLFCVWRVGAFTQMGDESICQRRSTAPIR